MNGNIDLHMHTTVSDGTDTPEELLDKVKGAGIGLFSVTDHDDIKGCAAIRAILAEGDPAFINGAEFSCKDGEGKYHILGYGYDPDTEGIQGLVAKSHEFRIEKVVGRLNFLEKEYGFTFPQEEIDELLALDNPGKPHIGNLMVEYGYAESRDVAIKDYINKVGFPNEFLQPEEAIQAILASGGIPVLAHPFYGSGDELILGDEMEERLRKLIGYGLQGVEAFYSGFPKKLRNQMLTLADRYSLYVTAGSDYHGENKLVILGDTGLTDPEDMPAGMLRFLNDIRKE